MPLIGYHCAHEQHRPSDLLRHVQQAQKAGFQAAMCSDHFAPWSEAQGQSGFAWSWLGAALQTTSFSLGTVNAPGQRYHPAVIAQAAATLSQMFPGRFWLAVGTGEALNEHITGDAWPAREARRARLLEAASILRRLWAGEVVTHEGRIRVHEAKLYTLPEQTPMLVGAAVSPETAEWVGGWADGLITVARPPEALSEVVTAFRRGGGAHKPMFLQVALSFAATEAEAEQLAFEGWRTNVVGSPTFKADTLHPSHFDAAAEFVRPPDLRRGVRISSDLAQHVEWLQADVSLGFERLYLHHVGTRAGVQERFIEAFATEVLPRLS